jgi:hypothetical protein
MGQRGNYFPNNIYLSNYYFNHRETTEETDNTSVGLLGRIVYRKNPQQDYVCLLLITATRK